MITLPNGNELRNLEEQVQKNKEDIAKHYAIDRTLANFGIKIVGTVSDASLLPDPTLYEGSYGDGYAVGQPGSYNYYIFTRPDPNSGQLTNYWLDVGELGIQGPQGPVGPEGPQGPRGEATRWYTSSAEAANGKPGDLWLDNHGWVFKKSTESNLWKSVTNIKGPQGIQGIRGPQGPQGETGPQGPKGDTGDVGGFINIAGILNNESSLPLPTDLNNLTVAYLVGTASPYELYIQVGSTSQDAIWENMGPLNVATYVTVNGKFQNVWDADTKLDKVTTAYKIYGTGENGSQIVYQTGWSPTASIFQLMDLTPNGGYNDDGSFDPYTTGTYMVGIPKKPSHATPKKWVEDNFTLYDHRLELSTSLDVTIYITLQKPYSNKITSPTQIPLGSYIVDYGWVTRTADNTWSYNFNNGDDTGGGMTVTIVNDIVSKVI